MHVFVMHCMPATESHASIPWWIWSQPLTIRQARRKMHLKELQQDSLKQSNPLERNPLFLMFSVWHFRLDPFWHILVFFMWRFIFVPLGTSTATTVMMMMMMMMSSWVHCQWSSSTANLGCLLLAGMALPSQLGWRSKTTFAFARWDRKIGILSLPLVDFFWTSRVSILCILPLWYFHILTSIAHSLVVIRSVFQWLCQWLKFRSVGYNVG